MTITGLRRWTLGDLHDARRHRGREQRGLAFVRRAFENRLEFVGETHVEHFVRFVEDHELDRIELERTALEVVEGAARRRDDHVDAAFERAQLLRDRLTAVDRHDAQTGAARIFVHGFRDLHREFARRHEDQAAGVALGVVVLAEHVQERQREGGGFARTGRGLAEDVAAGQQRRDRFTLNRSRFFVTERRQRGNQPFVEAECGKALIRRGTLVRRAIRFPSGQSSPNVRQRTALKRSNDCRAEPAQREVRSTAAN